MTTRTRFRHVCTFCDRMLRPEEVRLAAGDDGCIECAMALARKRAVIVNLKYDLFGPGHGYSASLAKEIEVAKADRST